MDSSRQSGGATAIPIPKAAKPLPTFTIPKLGADAEDAFPTGHKDTDDAAPAGAKCMRKYSSALLLTNTSGDWNLEDVYAPASPTSRRSSVASQGVVESQESAGRDDIASDLATVLEQVELQADGPVQSSSVTGNSGAKVGPQDFEILRLVGQGAFGKVFQVQHKKNGHVYAMKVMRKEKIYEKDHSHYIRSERDLLTAVFHPYIVTLRYTFQTASKLYLVLDFVNGGHLFFNLYREGVFSEDVAKLYTAEIVLAISYLHARGIVHRDLKPENVLLDSNGHIKITDFGLAKANMSEACRTNSFIGTMEYMAPEIISGKGHGKAVDWWSVGILLFEMLNGTPPFVAKSRQTLQNQILNGKIKFPRFISSQAQTFLKGLLTRDVERRLGAGPNGTAQVRNHPFFKTINWRRLEAGQVDSIYKPGVSNSLSVDNFDKVWTDQPAVDSPCNTPLDSRIQLAFKNFSYVAPAFFADSAPSNGFSTSPARH